MDTGVIELIYCTTILQQLLIVRKSISIHLLWLRPTLREAGLAGANLGGLGAMVGSILDRLPVYCRPTQ